MQIGVIGCGKMGTALVEGAIRSRVIAAADVIGVDPWPAAQEQFAKVTGARVADEISAVAGCEVILLCTKPLDALPAMRAAAEAGLGQSALVISIAAGITVSALEAVAEAIRASAPQAVAAQHLRVIRAMPNTPALVGKGAAGYCVGTRATPADAAIARLLLGAVGLAVEVPERLMDAVTGLSGSGPAYVYLIIEALADGGVCAGLPRAEAVLLAAQTVLGAATMVLETGKHPAMLKDMVTSPGGTTIAGLAVLERHGLRSALIEAVAAATRRSADLGQ